MLRSFSILFGVISSWELIEIWTIQPFVVVDLFLMRNHGKFRLYVYLLEGIHGTMTQRRGLVTQGMY